MLNTLFLADIRNILALSNLRLGAEVFPEVCDGEDSIGAFDDFVEGVSVV